MSTEKINTGYWYTDADCDAYRESSLDAELGGYAKDKKYLLQKTYKDEEDGKDWHVLVTPPVNGQRSVPAHELAIDYFLNKENQPDTTESIVRKIINLPNFEDEIDDKNVSTFLSQVIIDLGLDASTKLDDVKEILKNGKYGKIAIERILAERKKTLVHVGSLAAGVFDEVEELLEAGKEKKFKILFQCNLGAYPTDRKIGVGGSHWILGEVQILKNVDGSIHVKVFGHDPYGKGKMSDENFNKIKAAIEKRLKEIVGTVSIEIENKESPYNQRQTDGCSCGVIANSDLVKRVKGETLNVTSPYPVGAEDLRKYQLEVVEKSGNTTRIENFKKRNLIPEASKLTAKDTSPRQRSSSTSGLFQSVEKRSFTEIHQKLNEVFTKDKVKVEQTEEKASIKYDNHEIGYENKNGAHEFTMDSKELAKLKHAVEKIAEFLEKLDPSKTKKFEIEIQSPDDNTRKELEKICESKGFTLKGQGARSMTAPGN
jgi:hypothetical protein